MDRIEFIAEVKKVEAKTLISLDKAARIILETANLTILDVGKWRGDEVVKVTIERVPKGDIGLKE